MHVIIAGAIVSLGLATGCSQDDPLLPAGTGSSSGEGPATSTTEAATTETDTGELPAEADYYPLVDGATWTYLHTTKNGAQWDEVVTLSETTYEGAVAFEQEDNAGTNGESTTSTLVRDGTAILRVFKDVTLAGAPVATAAYDPGFLRFDHAWGAGDSIVWNYNRTEWDPAGTVIDDSLRNQIFTIESMSTEVEVPAGTFDCIQFTRERLETGEVKRFWFADGVGKVKHETLRTDATEELSEYSIP